MCDVGAGDRRSAIGNGQSAIGGRQSAVGGRGSSFVARGLLLFARCSEDLREFLVYVRSIHAILAHLV